MNGHFHTKEINEAHMNQLRQNYMEWKHRNKIENVPFFMVYTDFKEEHLKDISGGALKLYLYLGFHVNNTTGECWHSIDSISDFFGNDSRTVKNWIYELEERQLIKRIQRGYKWVANTFLLPYGDESKNYK